MTDGRELLVDACRILQAEGHEHFHLGHVSLREGPASDRYWVKRSGIGLGEVTIDDLVLVDLDGHRLVGSGAVHQEQPLHAEIYRRRPDAGAIVHTHPPYGSAWASAETPFRVIGQDSLPFARGVPRFDSARLITSAEQGRAVAEALGDRPLIALRNHGIAAVGSSIAEAVYLAVAFERSVRGQALAAALGTIREIPADEVEAMTADLEPTSSGRADAVFEYLRRTRIDRAG
jgi:L-fuculose-phosphate aldolase